MTTCPTLVPYDKATLARVAKEVTGLPPEAAVPVLLNDYSKMRDFCRKLKQRAR